VIKPDLKVIKFIGNPKALGLILSRKIINLKRKTIKMKKYLILITILLF